MDDYEIIACPGCRQRLGVPAGRGPLAVTCPKCSEEFFYPLVTRPSRRSPRRNARRWAWVAGGIGLAVLVLLSYPAKKTQEGASLGQADEAFPSRDDRWVTISYADLVDPEAIVRTGDPLRSALRDPALRGAVQPFLDRYSYLLQHTVHMLNGPDELPHTDVVDHFPPGSAQPVWAAIFRGGRIHLVADGRDHARVFLPGDTPAQAYEEHYSVIRHCLNGLVPSDGHPLTVEVFAYTNDYTASQLRLNTRSHEVSGTSFPSDKVQPDLAALAEFFSQKSIPEGAQLSRSDGLVLYGKTGPPPSLAGHDLSLADLAVVYRAAFHAGDNEAFISLDPHPDPTRVTVNFGGFLEDTHIGSVVLDSDKRFKTVTTGLDPDSPRDLRAYARQHVPSFMTASERDLVSEDFSGRSGWVGTRFWFYPDEAGVDTDLNYEFAVVAHPQFTADAERSRRDFVSPTEFERKKALLSPGIRQNIQHLNANYAQYAGAFTELGELTTVARLMGIASWLREAKPEWLDLDALLAVELPAHTTARERTQLLAATVLACRSDKRPSSEQVRANARVVYLTPILDSKVRDYFRTSENVARFLCIVHGSGPGTHAAYKEEASRLLGERGRDRVRDIVESRDDVKALAEYAADSLDVPLSRELAGLERSIERDERDLGRLEAEITAVKKKMESASPSAYNEHVDRHNWLVRQFNATQSRYQASVEEYNRAEPQSLSVTAVGGGINLEPRDFRIRRTRTSQRLAAFKDLTRSLRGRTRLRAQGADWIRSRPGTTGARLEVTRLPRVLWEVQRSTGPGDVSLVDASAESGERAWRLLEGRTGSWRSLVRKAPSRYGEASYQAERRTLRVAEFESGEATEHFVGQMEGNWIIFSRSERGNLLQPQEPPVWWRAAQSQ